jgi:hypothetical protein
VLAVLSNGAPRVHLANATAAGWLTQGGVAGIGVGDIV